MLRTWSPLTTHPVVDLLMALGWQSCCIGFCMVGVVFRSGRRFVFFDGEAAVRLKPGVEVYDATGKLLFCSQLEVLSVLVNGQRITTLNPT